MLTDIRWVFEGFDECTIILWQGRLRQVQVTIFWKRFSTSGFEDVKIWGIEECKEETSQLQEGCHASVLTTPCVIFYYLIQLICNPFYVYKLEASMKWDYSREEERTKEKKERKKLPKHSSAVSILFISFVSLESMKFVVDSNKCFNHNVWYSFLIYNKIKIINMREQCTRNEQCNESLIVQCCNSYQW